MCPVLTQSHPIHVVQIFIQTKDIKIYILDYYFNLYLSLYFLPDATFLPQKKKKKKKKKKKHLLDAIWGGFYIWFCLYVQIQT